MKWSTLRLALPCLVIASFSAAQPVDSLPIRPADLIDVVVLGQPSLSADFVVDKDGVISYPLLGKVEVGNLMPADVASKLQSLLGAGFIRRPEVSVRVKEYRSRPVLVLGEVVRPGVVSLRGDRSVLTMLAAAGGLTANAGHELLVARPPEGSETKAIDQFNSVPLVPGLVDQTRPSDVDDLPPGAIKGSDIFRASFRELSKGNAEQNVILESGDLVYVPKAGQIFVTGQAVRPGPLKYVEGMTVQDALQLVGGANDRGSMNRLRLIRFEAGKRKTIKVKLADLLKPGDTLNIGERFF
jgi:polysaccharide export outer membrane protein